MTNQTYSTNHADPDGVAAAYLAAVKAIDPSTWTTFATGYRTARKAYAVADALLPEQHALMLNDYYQRDLEADLTAYAVTTAADLIEKGELIALDSYMVNDAAAEALIADMARIRAVRAGGGRAAHLGEAYLAAASAASVAKDGDAENEWRESEVIWDRLAATPILNDADAAAKVGAVMAWMDAGNAERSDGTDRAMLAEVSAYLKV